MSSITGGYFFAKEKFGYEEFNFTSNPQEILRALLDSRQQQKMIALYMPANSDELFITAVDEIIHDEHDTIIVVKQFDNTGFIIEKNKIKLSEIVSACLLSSHWENPYMKVIIKDKVPWLRVK